MSGRVGDISFAIIAAHWDLHVAADDIADVRNASDHGSILRAAQERWFVAGLTRTIGRLKALGAKRILVIGPSPDFRHSAPRCLLWSDRLGVDRTRCAEPRESIDAKNGPILAALRRVAALSPDVRIADAISVLCDDALCRSDDAAGILYKDEDHLTDRGVDKLYAGLKRDFDWAFGRPQPALPSPPPCCVAP
jgi:hypothetical protein